MAMILTGKISEQGFEQDYVPNTEYFYSVSGKEIKAPSTIVWCNDCQKLCDGELLPSLAAINDRMERFRSGALDEVLGLDGVKRNSEISEMELLRNLRKARKSEAKCLVCGGSSITEVDEPEGYSPEYPPIKLTVKYMNGEHQLLIYISGHANLKSMGKVVLNEEGQIA
ncbi:hypothetical protein [Teredinibacter franksiae]|uniref:hypothetical protein n=1 Tax=Teredinibacter franksiae TaxID=2761453 RepID=UPI001624687F|nr:hypothetical protein [Teredinibacter franksiae]